MTTIYLIRHGHKQAEFGDPGLTETGFKQAKETGEHLKQFPITGIISSPFRRTIETAQTIGEILEIEHTLDGALAERMNWADGNVPFDEFVQEWIKATHDRQYVPKYGDSSQATGQRVHKLVENLENQDSHIVLVSHGGAIVDYLRTLFGDQTLAPLRNRYPEGEDFQMFNCSINKVVFSNNPTLELLNFTDHLSGTTE